jgi:hypothetical protein
MLQKTKVLMFIRVRGEWRPETVYPGRCLGVRQGGHRIRAADLKNGGPRYFQLRAAIRKEFFFLNELSWDLIENKGPLWKTGRRSWNVIEKTGTYPVKAGML